MTINPLRFVFDLIGLAFLTAGVLIFAAAVTYTIYAFFDPQALYGLHVPILGFGALLIGGVPGGLRLIAIRNRNVGRTEKTTPLNTIKA